MVMVAIILLNQPQPHQKKLSVKLLQTMTQLLSERLTYTDCDMLGGEIGFIRGLYIAVGDRLFR